MIEAKTYHLDKRWQERIVSLGIDEETSNHMLEIATNYAMQCPEDTAQLLFRMNKRVGKFWGNESNGDEVWIVVRDQIIITILFRRSTQPSNRQTLKVDKVCSKPLVENVIIVQ